VILRILKQINPWASLAGLPTLAWWLALATFLNRAGTMVLPFLLLYLIRHLRWEPEKAALILTLYGLTSMVAGPVSGRLCDRFGSGKVLCCSLFASSCVMLVFPLVTSAPLIAATTVLLSFFSESFRPAALSIQARVLTPELRQRGFTLNRLAANAGMSIGPAVGGLLASLWFPAIFLVDGLSALLASILMSRLVWGVGVKSGRSTENATEGSPLKNRNFLTLLAGTFLVALGFSQLESTMPLTVVNGLGMSEREFGLLFTVNTIFILLFEVAINQRTAGWKPSNALFWGAALVGLGLGGTALVGGLGSLLAMSVVWTVGEIMYFPAQLSKVAVMASEEQMGAYMGYLTSSSGLAFTLAPLLGVPLYTQLGQGLFWPLILVLCTLGGYLTGRS